jgi:hypothetical protein
MNDYAELQARITGYFKRLTATTNPPDSVERANLATLIQVDLALTQIMAAKKLERFTCWLIGLTVALIFIGVVQIVLMFCGHKS